MAQVADGMGAEESMCVCVCVYNNLTTMKEATTTTTIRRRRTRRKELHGTQ